MFPVSFCKLLLLFWLAFSCCETKHLLTGSSDQTITDRWQSVVYSFQQRVVVIQTPFKMSIQPHMQSTLTKKMEQSILFIAGWLHAHLFGNVLVCGRVWAASRCTTALWPQRFSSSAGWAACWSARSQNSACPWISARKRRMIAFVKDKKQYRHLQNKRSSRKKHFCFLW